MSDQVQQIINVPIVNPIVNPYEHHHNTPHLVHDPQLLHKLHQNSQKQGQITVLDLKNDRNHYLTHVSNSYATWPVDTSLATNRVVNDIDGESTTLVEY